MTSEPLRGPWPDAHEPDAPLQAQVRQLAEQLRHCQEERKQERAHFALIVLHLSRQLGQKDLQIEKYRERQEWSRELDQVPAKQLSTADKAVIRALEPKFRNMADRREATPERIHIPEIAELAGVSTHRVSQILDRLDEGGYIEKKRIRDPGNGHSQVLVAPTSALLETPSAIVPPKERNHGGRRISCPDCGPDVGLVLETQRVIKCARCDKSLDVRIDRRVIAADPKPLQEDPEPASVVPGSDSLTLQPGTPNEQVALWSLTEEGGTPDEQVVRRVLTEEDSTTKEGANIHLPVGSTYISNGKVQNGREPDHATVVEPVRRSADPPHGDSGYDLRWLPDEDMPLGDAAMLYAIRGWPVFPLIGKVPAVRSGHGYKDATTDIVQVCEWWAKYPDANIGIATGAAGLVVIDPDKEGDKAWRELAHRLMLPQTLMAYTGGGGMHVYFVAPSSPRVGNSAGKLLPHVDVRGWGGYIVLPPSIHPDTGKRYAWIPHTQLSICPLPKPLLKMLFPPPAPSRRVTVTDSINPDWWLKGRTFREGERNWCLYQTACSIVNHVQSLDELVSLTLAVNDARCIPPLPEAEARQVAHNASAFL